MLVIIVALLLFIVYCYLFIILLQVDKVKKQFNERICKLTDEIHSLEMVCFSYKYSFLKLVYSTINISVNGGIVLGWY